MEEWGGGGTHISRIIKRNVDPAIAKLQAAPRLIIAARILSSSREIWKVIAIRPTTVPAGFQRCGRIIMEAGAARVIEKRQKNRDPERKRDGGRRWGRGASRWRVQERIKGRVAVDLPIDNGFHLYNSTPLAPTPSIHFAFSPPVRARCVRDAFFLPSLPFRVSRNTWWRRTYALSGRWKTGARRLSLSVLPLSRHWILSGRERSIATFSRNSIRTERSNGK